MTNAWRDCDPNRLVVIEAVASKLADIVPGDRLMLVGAQCRDLLHWRAGCEHLGPRSTTDIDMAIAIPNWDDFAAISRRFRAIAAALLGVDVRSRLSAHERNVLSARLVAAVRDLLAEYFTVGIPSWPTSRTGLVSAMFDQIVFRGG